LCSFLLVASPRCLTEHWCFSTTTYLSCATDRSLGRGRVTERNLVGIFFCLLGLFGLFWRSFLVPETSTFVYQLLHYCYSRFHYSLLHLRITGYCGNFITFVTYSAFSLESGHWSCFGLVIHIHQKAAHGIHHHTTAHNAVITTSHAIRSTRGQVGNR